jgi:predicted nucleotidyltransferase
MQAEDSISVSDLARRTRTVVERLVREPYRRLIVLRNPPSGGDLRPPGRLERTGKDGGLRAVLLRKKDLIRSIAQARGARSIRLFGSVARGEERPDSDIDVLVEFEPGRSLLDLIGLENDLAGVLGRRVEVITEKGAKPHMLKAALRDAVRIV